MRLPSESKQQLFLKSLFQENLLLRSGMGMVLAVTATVNTDQAFFVGGIALLIIIFNSLMTSILSDIFHYVWPMWIRVMVTSIILSLLIIAFEDKIASLPGHTAWLLLTLIACPLAYARSKVFAESSTPGRALYDAAGAGLGLVLALLGIALIREVSGFGSLGNLALFSAPPLPMMRQAFGGFTAAALVIVIFRLLAKKFTL
jgi:Na+-transporting NADH:ubiquinone oxidoreductase subunit NqrD